MEDDNIIEFCNGSKIIVPKVNDINALRGVSNKNIEFFTFLDEIEENDEINT